MADGPAFSRSNGGDAHVELRGPCPQWIVGVLDAVALAREISRTELITGILGEWAEKRMHEATLISRVTRGNGRPSESRGNGTE